MNYRKGDIVSVLGIVRHGKAEGNYVFVDVTGIHTTVMLEPKEITLVAAKFEVGDKCRLATDTAIGCAEDDPVGTILAISDGHAWIEIFPGGNYCTRQLTSIERIESDE